MTRSTDAHWAKLALQVEAELMQRVPENDIRPRLEPTRRAVELLGDPQKSYRVIHVTGTNGKTSTTRIIERILREHGLRTGRFTSPHLIRLNERIAIDGEPVSDQVLWELWEDTKPILELVDSELAATGEQPLTFFEALSALGFAIFGDAPIDVLVLEVGLGGAWDSTNVADGDVAVFSPIGLDHMDRLGETVGEIAETKAGIIKPGSVVVSAFQHSQGSEVLRAVANEKADSFNQLGEAFNITERSIDGFGQRFSLTGLAGTYADLYLPLIGAHQVENAAVAIAAVEAFLGGGQQAIADDILRVALADVSSPGRLQVLGRSPLRVLDAAHNPEGAAVLAGSLEAAFPTARFAGVVAILRDKDAAGILRALEPVLYEVVVTKSKNARSLSVEELEDLAIEIFGEHRVRSAASVSAALSVAEGILEDGEADSIVITGSISMLGEVILRERALDNSDYDENDDFEEESEDTDSSFSDSSEMDYEDGE